MPTGKYKLMLLALLIALGLSGGIMNQVALAQSSLHFDLGCWGIFLGGAASQSPTYTIRQTVGQWTSGTATSPTAIIRSGYIQHWGALYTPTPDPNPGPTPDAFQFYLPFAPKQLRVVRTCHQ